MSELILPDDDPESWEKVKEFLEPKAPLYSPHKPFLRQKVFLRTQALEALYGGRASGGKDLALDTVIFSTNGWTTIGDLKVGDFVFDENGEPTQVLAKSEIFYDHNVYRVEMSDGEVITAGENHLWNVAKERERARYAATDPSAQAKRRANRASRAQTPEQVAAKALEKGDGRGLTTGNSESASLSNSIRAAKAREGKTRPSIWDYTSTLPTKEVIELQKSERKRVSIPNAAPIMTEMGWESSIPPYTLGVWLGDGNSQNGHIACAESDREALVYELEADGWEVSIAHTERREGRQPVHLLKLVNAKTGDSLRHLLRMEGLLNNKHVPDWVIFSPFADRQAFIGGFFDTDGSIDADRGRIEFGLAVEHMVRDVHSILWSMGMSPTKIYYKKTHNQHEGFEGECWRFHLSQCSEYLFRLPRKRDLLRSSQLREKMDRKEYRSIKSITKVPTVPTQCIQVDNPRGLFRIGRSFLVTHNSDALLMGALQYVDVPGYAAILFRNSYADLMLPGALMDRFKEWMDDYPEVSGSTNSSTWTFPSGARVTFGYLNKVDDHLRYKGAECQYLGFDELTEIREQHYRYLLSRLRKPSHGPLAKVPLRARSASNPAPNWVRRYFIEEGPSKGRIYVPAGVDDNPHVEKKSYAEALARLSPVDFARLSKGDWYAEESGNLFDRDDFEIIGMDQVPDRAFENVVRYWDLAGTKPSDAYPDPDYTVGVKASIVDGFFFILDIRRFREEAHDVERLIAQTAMEDGPSVKIRMEKDPGQAGKSQISHYGRHVLLGYDFDGNPVNKNKPQRVSLWAPKVKRKEMILVRGNWVTEFIDEAMSFDPSPESNKTSNIHDDQMDAVSGAFEVLTGIYSKRRKSVEIIV